MLLVTIIIIGLPGQKLKYSALSTFWPDISEVFPILTFARNAYYCNINEFYGSQTAAAQKEENDLPTDRILCDFVPIIAFDRCRYAIQLSFGPFFK